MSEIFIIKNTGKGIINSLAPENIVPIKSAGSSDKFSEIVIEAETDGIEIPITGGTYMVYNFRGQTVYRYMTTATNTNGYPIEDSFYDNLTAGVLSNKLTQRNQ